MKKDVSKVVWVTGASSGFGEAISHHLASLGFSLAIGARRTERLNQIKEKIQEDYGTEVFVHPLDVQWDKSVNEFVRKSYEHFGKVNALINNAGFAHGLSTIENGNPEDWKAIWETNVMGTVRMIQAVTPLMKPSTGCRIVNIGSVSGMETYEGGGAYCSSKFALRAVTLTLRYELMKKEIGVTSIDPGMAETEFSMVRFDQDQDRAKKVYEGIKPLSAKDIAEIAGFVLTRPAHVNIDQLVVYPLAQSSGNRTLRRS